MYAWLNGIRSGQSCMPVIRRSKTTIVDVLKSRFTTQVPKNCDLTFTEIKVYHFSSAVMFEDAKN